MTVAELIIQLQKMPQNLPVSFNDESGHHFIEDISGVFHLPYNKEYGDRECVIIYYEE